MIGRSARCPSAEPGHCAQLYGRKSASKSVFPSLAPRTDELERALFQEFAWPHAACHRLPNACFTLHSDDGTPTVRNIVINGRHVTRISAHTLEQLAFRKSSKPSKARSVKRRENTKREESRHKWPCAGRQLRLQLRAAVPTSAVPPVQAEGQLRPGQPALGPHFARGHWQAP